MGAACRERIYNVTSQRAKAVSTCIYLKGVARGCVLISLDHEDFITHLPPWKRKDGCGARGGQLVSREKFRKENTACHSKCVAKGFS
jgi:hypothetical protein